MKIYAAIGRWKENENITSVAASQTTKTDFVKDLRANGFVPYVVITEKMFERISRAKDCFAVYEIVKKMTTNYRVWNDVTDYLEQCFDILTERVNTSKVGM